MRPPRLPGLQRDLQQQTGPTLDAVCGPSFPLTVKILASALVAALAVSAAMVLTGPSRERIGAMDASQWGFLLAVGAVIVSGYWGILTSRTRCDGESIEQSWLWHKKVAIADITQVKLISLRGLGWLVVPRLVVRTGYGLTTFQAGDPAVLERFRLLAHGR